jgi:hypothetical protein
MNLNTLSLIFNRALFSTFIKKKLLMVFCVLALSGLLVVFFRGLAWNAGEWVKLSLTFLPIFLCSGILLSTGIFLIRIYHNEIKQRSTTYTEILAKSWEVIIGASYFSIPIILTYLLLWMLLGIFVLLREIPAVGEFFSVILSFAPFLINLGALLLCLVSLLMLFFVTPIIALKGMDRGLVFQVIVKRMEKDPFSNIVLVLLALLPLLFILGLLILSAILTKFIYLNHDSLPEIVLEWFFIMLPFTAILTPSVIFFFNFAAESHALMQKIDKNQTS